MTLAVPGSTGFVALAQRAVIGMTVRPVGHDSTSRRPNVNRREGVAGSRRPSLRAPGCAVERTCHCGAHAAYQPIQAVRPMFAVQTGTPTDVRAHPTAGGRQHRPGTVSYTHLRAHETR